MSRTVSRLHYFDAPVVKEITNDYLMLESIRNKVWNPVFTIGAITFFLSMTLRGFFDQVYAVFPLAISTLVLLWGIWILSASAQVVFDKNESKVFFVYKHLGYLQKIYTYPLSSIEEIIVKKSGHEKNSLQLLKDDGVLIKIAETKDALLLNSTANEISHFIDVQVKTN